MRINKMKQIAIEDLIADTILWFCENAAELGCPRDKEVDMWFRELDKTDQFKVGEKLLDIMERDARDAIISKKEKEMSKDKEIKMIEMEIDLDKDLYDKLIPYALKEIEKDEPALINYIVNKALIHAVKNEKEFKKLVKKNK